MEEKKTMRGKKGDTWTTLLLDGIFGSLSSFVSSMVHMIHETTHAVTRRLARRAFLFLFSFAGIVFLLVGFAKLLNSVYQFPGLGETIVGMLVLLISLVIYALTRNE